MKGLEIIREYNSGKTDWLPLISSCGRIVPKREENGEVNIGWNAGLLQGNRPFYCECWAIDGITMITLFFSAEGLDIDDEAQAEKLFVENGYYKPKKGYEAKGKDGLIRFKDADNNEFYSFNVTVGIEDEPAQITGANIYPFSILNEYNSENIL